MPFDGALAAQLGTTPGNFVVSPASIALGLAMAREGARGQTADELDDVLGADARSVAKALLARHATSPLLAIANRLFGDRALEVAQAFATLTERDYGARITTLDFGNTPDAARVEINAWVAQMTRDKIQQLMPPRSITARTRLVLVDAVYLKAAWKTPFDAHLTSPATFAVAGGGPTWVPTMRCVAHVKWGEHAGARVVQLPYANTELAMIVVVPHRQPLDIVEAAYARTGLAPFRAALAHEGRSALVMPRFEARTGLDLRAALEHIGLVHPFSDQADFSGMATAEQLAISSVVHQAWIEVGEAGTEAAAATAVAIAAGGPDPRVEHSFAVDRSFLFFVHDDRDNVLFGGRVIDPSACGGVGF